MEKMVYTVRDIAQILCVGMNKAYDLIHEDKIPYIRLGRKIRITRNAFEEWLNEGHLAKEN